MRRRHVEPGSGEWGDPECPVRGTGGPVGLALLQRGQHVEHGPTHFGNGVTPFLHRQSWQVQGRYSSTDVGKSIETEIEVAEGVVDAGVDAEREDEGGRRESADLDQCIRED